MIKVKLRGMPLSFFYLEERQVWEESAHSETIFLDFKIIHHDILDHRKEVFNIEGKLIKL